MVSFVDTCDVAASLLAATSAIILRPGPGVLPGAVHASLCGRLLALCEACSPGSCRRTIA
jgi:hypothetical protein